MRVESVGKVERPTLAVECTKADFRTLGTALHQVFHRMTTNEPRRTAQQAQCQKGLEAWHLIVRRHDQRNTSDRSSAYGALNSNISERGRAKDVDILRNFMNETNKYNGRFGEIRHEEKILAVQKMDAPEF